MPKNVKIQKKKILRKKPKILIMKNNILPK